MGLAIVSYFKNILVPVDGSSYSLQAEELVADLAKRFNSKVTVLHVVPHQIKHPPEEYVGVPKSIREEMEGWFLQRGRQVIQEARALYTQEGITPETILEEFADPAETILDIAKMKKSDTLVLGNLGSSEIADFSLGGVAENVLRHANCPLLIVKKKAEFSKILVAVDGSKHAKNALNYAVQLGVKYKSKVTLLNVAQTMLPIMKTETAKSVGERVVSEAEAQVKEMKTDKKVEVGHPAKTILEFAKKENYDLIVLGRRGLNPVKRFFLGSVCDKVARHAQCSVLIVR